MASVPGFLTKTYEIFNNPSFSDCCGWGQDGDTIIIRKIDLFSKDVLPKYFKHSNFQSFVRQLNMYDFHKTVQDPTHGEFQHQYFKRNRPDLLAYIKRKAHNKNVDVFKKDGTVVVSTETAELEPENRDVDILQIIETDNAPFLDPALNTSSSSLLHKVMRVKKDRQSLDSETRGDKGKASEDGEPRLAQLESQIARLLNDHSILKRIVLEARSRQNRMQEKMDKVLKLLYNIFHTNANPTAIVPPMLSEGEGIDAEKDNRGSRKDSGLGLPLGGVGMDRATIGAALQRISSIPLNGDGVSGSSPFLDSYSLLQYDNAAEEAAFREAEAFLEFDSQVARSAAPRKGKAAGAASNKPDLLRNNSLYSSDIAESDVTAIDYANASSYFGLEDKFAVPSISVPKSKDKSSSRASKSSRASAAARNAAGSSMMRNSFKPPSDDIFFMKSEGSRLTDSVFGGGELKRLSSVSSNVSEDPFSLGFGRLPSLETWVEFGTSGSSVTSGADGSIGIKRAGGGSDDAITKKESLGAPLTRLDSLELTLATLMDHEESQHAPELVLSAPQATIAAGTEANIEHGRKRAKPSPKASVT